MGLHFLVCLIMFNYHGFNYGEAWRIGELSGLIRMKGLAVFTEG